MYKFENFCVRESIWENIESLTNCVEEKNQIKKAIGESLVDETLDLHQEVAILYEIWKEYHEEVSNNMLPEPPLQRENLEKQIGLLVKLLQQKVAKQGGRSLGVTLTDEERALVKNVAKRKCPTSCQTCESSKQQLSSASSSHTTPSSGYDSRCSSSLSVDLNVLQDSINMMEMDKIVQPLQEDFEDERKGLLQDIQYIQDALIYEGEEENKRRKQRSPTLTELRRLSSKLEKEVLLDDPFKFSAVSSDINPPHCGMSSIQRSPSTEIHSKMSPSPPSTACTSSFRRNHVLSPLNSPGKLVAAKTFSLPLKGEREVRKDDNGNIHQLLPSPPTGEKSNFKPNVTKLQNHVHNEIAS
ncbi:uncharacterized protein LOC130630529 isoform X2 [Hydractinia symbiolongicarpus]|uniref:uncharacterized protein LOC130630529 isoform X2 n=1 Tax=Hydractinia symbiolongicarpus TaxID=13093 RepID=UPI00254DEF25|nr:uncharacterized protein LOC130630529 isoform X2 [Hydractinia symbiolongicarpus]